MLWRLAQPYRLVFHEHWQTDLLGHHRALGEAVADLELFDAFLGGLLAAADLEETLIVVASDHGNVEDCSHSRHTLNPALGLLIGVRAGVRMPAPATLADIAPAILAFLGD